MFSTYHAVLIHTLFQFSGVEKVESRESQTPGIPLKWL